MSQDLDTAARCVYWLVDSRILMLEIEAEAPHLLPFYDEVIIRYLDASLTPIDLVVKPPEQDSKPASITQLTALKIPKHPRLSCIAFVTSHTNPITRFLIQVLNKVAGLHLRSFEDIDSAIRGLQVMHEQQSGANNA